MDVQINIRTEPKPTCPECDAVMALRMPRAEQTWKPFWGCSTFPNCRATRNILPNGLPEDDEIDFDDIEWDDIENDWHPGHPSNYGDS